MQIVQTKVTQARPIQEAQGEEFRVFRDRRSLHRGEVPGWFVYIHEYAWEAFLNHTTEIYDRTGHEGQGIFAGKYFRDEFGEFAVATTYFEGEGESSRSHVEMSEQCLSFISKGCLAEDLLMLIWVHTHPTFGAFYSGTDVNCLRTNFYMPFQTGIVVDIIRRELKGFRVNAGEVVGFDDFAICGGESTHIFRPYESEGARAVRGQGMDIKRKVPEAARAPTDEVLREVKAINAALPPIRARLEELLAREQTAPQERAADDGPFAAEVVSLRQDVALLKELIRKVEAAQTQCDSTSPLTPPLERIEAEVKSLGLLSDKTDALTGAVQSHAKELSRQTKVQLALLALAALVFLILLLRLTITP
jgi:proteasome lid subunit RPN8/RPN11